VTGVTNMPLLPAWVALLLALGLVLLAWRRESK
jgi:LPXTG-motif cell wall-anchored protein